jgi:rhodanese-related sulfurtransferase
LTYRSLGDAEQICPTTTRRRLAEGAVLVDVRETAEIERLAFDVENVIALPMSELEARFAELPRDRDLVLVCAVGVRSLKATYFLMYHGFTTVANMDGGITKWAAKGFPVKGDVPAHEAGHGAGACCGGDAKAGDEKCCEPSPAAGGCC